jgi:hypothetical protein
MNTFTVLWFNTISKQLDEGYYKGYHKQQALKEQYDLAVMIIGGYYH